MQDSAHGPHASNSRMPAGMQATEETVIRNRIGARRTNDIVIQQAQVHAEDEQVAEDTPSEKLIFSPWTHIYLLGFLILGFLFLSTVFKDDSTKEGVVVLKNGIRIPEEQAYPGGGYVYSGTKYGNARRFEHSTLNTDFTYLKLNELFHPKRGYVCPHHPSNSPGYPNSGVRMDEDCLYLDVYVPPRKENHPAQLPVLFWIHGAGNKNIYDGTILAEAADAIVVTVNYRLSAFGFLSTGDDIARGNWGLGDLKVALNWTIDNIAAFGGDPAQITISGKGAGGTLTSALFLDDDIRYKVKAGIALSGSVLSRRAIMGNPGGTTQILAGHLGCVNQTSAEALACMKTLPWEKLLEGTRFLETPDNKNSYATYYGLVLDGLHIPKTPERILRERALRKGDYSKKKVATFITGCTKEDASIFYPNTAPEISKDSLQPDYTSVTTLLAEHIVYLCGANCSLAEAEVEAVNTFRFYGVAEGSSSDEVLCAYHQIIADLVYGLSAMKESQLYAEEPNNGYNQMLVTRFDRQSITPGAPHVLEIIHLFRGKWDAMVDGKVSEPLTKAFHKYIRQILYTGHYDGPYFGQEGNYHELTPDGIFVHKKADFSPTIDLLEDLLHCGSDRLTGLPDNEYGKAANETKKNSRVPLAQSAA